MTEPTESPSPSTGLRTDSTEPSTSRTPGSEPPAERPEGWELVDYGVLREKAGAELTKVVEQRINRLYGQVKEKDKVLAQLLEDQKTLLGRVDHLSKSESDRERDRLKSELERAVDEGRGKDAATLAEKIALLNLPRETAKPAEPEKPAKPAEAPPEISEIMTAEEEAQLKVWAMETDEDGRALRPWMNPNHPKNRVALKMIEAVLLDPDLEGKSALEKMAAVDQKMGVSRGTPRIATPAVLGSTTAPNRGNARLPNLNNEQQKIAAKLNVKPENYAAALKASTQGGSMNMHFVVDQ